MHDKREISVPILNLKNLLTNQKRVWKISLKLLDILLEQMKITQIYLS